LIGEWLAAAGYGVHTAPRGEAALAVLSDLRASLLITDMEMPGMDPDALLSSMNRSHPGIPIIAMSGRFDSPGGVSSRTIFALGASRVLCKPFSRESLVKAVHELIGSGQGLPP
jgi:CheY-like chemotaxis protein